MASVPTLTSALPLRLLEHALEPAHSRERASFEVTIAAESLFLRGHFPGRPIFPGIAQVAAIVLPGIHQLWPALVQPRRLSRLKFRAPISPGDALILTLERGGSRERALPVDAGGYAVQRGCVGFFAGMSSDLVCMRVRPRERAYVRGPWTPRRPQRTLTA
jgi:3-hydroxymyristoyl/3-hydroxydecanoyl-(acyl carrier protein) dehydratase